MSCDTERYGQISQKEVTKILIETFGARKSQHHGAANILIFNKEKFERVGMTYEVSIDPADGGIDGIDGDDIKCGMDAYVEDNHCTTTIEQETSVRVNDHQSDVNPEDEADTQNIGIDGDDGIDAKEEASYGGGSINDSRLKDLDSSSNTETVAGQSQMSNSNHSLTYIGIQIRKAIAVAATSVYTNTINLSHLSQVSQQAGHLTAELIKFFHDDPELPYRPLPPHTLEESPVKSIIKKDKNSEYCCIFHPDIKYANLETVEHHIKYSDTEFHKSKLSKQEQSSKALGING